MRYNHQEKQHFDLAVIQKEEFEILISGLIRETIRDEVQKIIEENEVKYLSVKEAAEMLSVSKATIHNYKRNGMLPYNKMGKSVRFLKADIRFFMENRKIRSRYNY